MSVCTFFGHRDCPDSVREPLLCAVNEMIEQRDVKQFFVGNQGNFDRMALSILRQAAGKYEIDYAVVLPYLSTGTVENYSPEETLLPECVELAPKRFAIDRRNHWMLQQSDCVIAYTTHSWSGAAKFVNIAGKSGKYVIQLGKNKRHPEI